MQSIYLSFYLDWFSDVANLPGEPLHGSQGQHLLPPVQLCDGEHDPGAAGERLHHLQPGKERPREEVSWYHTGKYLSLRKN